MVEQQYFNLLKLWCDGLLTYQIKDTGNPRFDGALLCPSCMVIHGRCHDAVYPLLYLADRTGEQKYLEAAVKLFHWGENLLCDDGSFYNDAQSDWAGITAFTAMGLYDSLKYHSTLLTDSLKIQFEDRFRRTAQWVYEILTPEFMNNINYQAAAAAVMASAGIYFDIPAYQERGSVLSKLCLTHITEDGLFYGEGKPRESLSERGCRPVDIGYNVEESLPALLIYAREMGDEGKLAKVKELLTRHLDFMLPDGGWDNSFGTRNYKWTYWGSRTSDGCQSAYGVWGKEEPLFAEASNRNVRLYEDNTHNGLLYGGPDYFAHGELPCIHHTFCHAKALAAALDHGLWETEPVKLPMEMGDSIKYYPTLDVYKIAEGDYLATITGYDCCLDDGGHASGGCLTLLWHKKSGPILVSSMTKYVLRENHNMQLSLKKKEHQPLTASLEVFSDGQHFSQCYDKKASIREEQIADGIKFIVSTVPADEDGHRPPLKEESHVVYQVQKDSFRIHVEKAEGCVFQLPVLSQHKYGYEKVDHGFVIHGKGYDISVTADRVLAEPEPVFFLAGGFEAWKLWVGPDEENNIDLEIRVIV